MLFKRIHKLTALFITVGLILVFLLLALSVWWKVVLAYDSEVLPFISGGTEFAYVREGKVMIPEEQIQLLEKVLLQDLSGLKALTHQLSDLEARHGFFVNEQGVTFFIFDAQDIIITEPLPVSTTWLHRQDKRESGSYHYWSVQERENPFDERLSAWDRYERVRAKRWMLEVSSNRGSGLYYQQKGLVFVGSLEEGGSTMRMEFAQSPRFLGRPFEEKEVNGGSGYISSGISLEGVPYWDSVSEDHLVNRLFPGQLTISSGTIAELLANPYEEDIEWAIILQGDDRAESLERAILDDLSRRYPQIKEVKLPDNTAVLEILRDESSFQEPEGAETLGGRFTYPHGQIVLERSGEGEWIARKGEEATEMATVDNSCFLPGSLVDGVVDINGEEMVLGKSMHFSYTTQHFVVCVQR